MARRRATPAAKGARFEMRVTPEERRELAIAAEADGLDASSWARRVLRTAAAERIAQLRSDEEREPSEQAVAEALSVLGTLPADEARHLRTTLRRAREHWGPKR